MQGFDRAKNAILSYMKMSPTELDLHCVPMIFDFYDIVSSASEENQVAFPKALPPNYVSIYDKEVILIDIGS